MAKYGAGYYKLILACESLLRVFFSGIDMTTLVSNLDNTASEIVTYQRDSTVQRKDLAQKTKDFRKLDDATKLVEYKALLKGTLTSHCSL